MYVTNTLQHQLLIGDYNNKWMEIIVHHLATTVIVPVKVHYNY